MGKKNIGRTNIIMGIGRIVGSVFKGIGWMCNEMFKEATGIDVKEIVSPLAESYKEGESISKEITEFEANKESFIKDYGEDEYYLELEYLKDSYEMELGDFKDTFNGMKYDFEDVIQKRKKEKIIIVKKKISKMSDKQILYVLNKKEVSPNMYELLEQERIARGI